MLDVDWEGISADDGGWDHIFEPAVWHPAAHRIQVLELLDQRHDELVEILPQDSGESAAVVQRPFNDSLDIPNLLRRAIYEHNPELYVIPQRPKRRRGKRIDFTLAEALYKLQQDPESPGLGTGTWKKRKAGFEEFLRIHCEITGHARKATRSGLRAAFQQQGYAAQTAWYWISLVRQKMYSGARGKTRELVPPPESSVMSASVQLPQASPFPESLDVHGMLNTWNLDIRFGKDAVESAQRSNLQGSDLVAALQQSTAHIAIWQAFQNFVETLAAVWAFATWACCMEISLNAEAYGRVHLHAFWGQAVSGSGWQTTKTMHRIYPERLRWDGRLPDIQVMRLNPRQSQADRTVGGVYYCMAKKEGSMFRNGNVQPFKEPSYKRHLPSRVQISTTCRVSQHEVFECHMYNIGWC